MGMAPNVSGGGVKAVVAAHRNERFGDLPDSEVRRLVEGLGSLQEGDLGVSVVVACGGRAVPFLRDILLHGRRMSVADGRRRLVLALAELGAKDVLLEYLRSEKHTSDPILRFAEETVESAAARALARWQTDEVFEELLYSASKRALPGVIEGLATFGRPEAIPYLIRALEDDVGRCPVIDALRQFGDSAWPQLIQAAQPPTASQEIESPSSLLRRRTAAQLLAEADLPADKWPEVRGLLQDEDNEVGASAARMALRIGGEEDTSVAVRRLCDGLASTNWLFRSEVEDCLVEHFGRVRRAIECEIVRHESGLKRQQDNDRVLTCLKRVSDRASNERGEHH